MSSIGHFPWLVSLLNAAFSYTEAGKSLKFISKVALDLIKARRESGQGDKVYSSNIIGLVINFIKKYDFDT